MVVAYRFVPGMFDANGDGEMDLIIASKVPVGANYVPNAKLGPFQQWVKDNGNDVRAKFHIGKPLFTAYLYDPDGVSSVHMAAQPVDELFDATQRKEAFDETTLTAGVSPTFAKLQPAAKCADMLFGRARL